MREAGFLFYFLFPQKQMRDAGLLFFSSKTDEACIYMSRYTLRQCSMGDVLHVRPLMIFGPIQEPCYGRPWPAVYINFVLKIHQIQVLTEPLCRAQASFYALPNNERGTKYRGLTYSAR